MASLGEISVGFSAATGGFTRGTATMIAGIDSTVAKLQASANPLTRTAGHIAAVGASATKAAARIASVGAALAPIAAAGALVKIGRQSEDFAAAMNNSTAIMSGVTPGIREAMTNVAIDVAKQTKFSAKEAAEAYFFLASAGLDAAASMAALPEVAQFAQAGNFDLSTATDLLTDAQSALGMVSGDTAKDLENLQRVSDVLVKANTLANASVQQFSEALTNKAAAASRQAGKGIEETISVLAAFADQGIKGVRAGEAYSIVLRDLGTKSLKNAEAFRQAGIAVFDQAGGMNHLGDIFSDMEAKLGGLSVAQQKMTLQQLGFTDQSLSYISALIGMSDKIRGYNEGVNEAGKITKSVAANQLSAFAAATNRLSAAWEEFAIKIGTPVMQALGDALTTYVIPAFEQWLSILQSDFTAGFDPETITKKVRGSIESLGWIGDAVQGLKSMFTGLQGIAAGAYGIILTGLSKLLSVAEAVWQRIGSFAEKMRGVVPGMGAIADQLKDVSFGADTAAEMGKSLRELSSNKLKSADDLLMQTRPSEQLSQMFDKLEREQAKTKAAMEQAAVDKLAVKPETLDAIAAAGAAFRESLALSSDDVHGTLSDVAAQSAFDIQVEADTAGFFSKYNAAAEALAAQSIQPEIAPRFTEDQLAEMKPIAERLFEQTRTPIERMQSKMTELQGVFDAGLITPDTFQRALEQLQTEAASLAEVPEQQLPPVEPFKMAEAVDLTSGGIGGAIRSVFSGRASTAARELAEAEKQTKQNAEANQLLNEIKTLLDKHPTIVEAPIG